MFNVHTSINFDLSAITKKQEEEEEKGLIRKHWRKTDTIWNKKETLGLAAFFFYIYNTMEIPSKTDDRFTFITKWKRNINRSLRISERKIITDRWKNWLCCQLSKQTNWVVKEWV